MERRSRRFPLARVGLAIGAALLLAACAGPSPRPDAQGAEAPLGVTDVGPAPVVYVYVPEPDGPHRPSPPTARGGVWVESVDTGENASDQCPARLGPPPGPPARSRADYACSG